MQFTAKPLYLVLKKYVTNSQAFIVSLVLCLPAIQDLT